MFEGLIKEDGRERRFKLSNYKQYGDKSKQEIVTAESYQADILVASN